MRLIGISTENIQTGHVDNARLEQVMYWEAGGLYATK